MRILIGLPVYKRHWILPLWFDRIEKQNYDLSDIGFCFFVSSYEEDKETHHILMNWLEKHPNVAHFSLHQEDSIKHYHHINGKRAWGKDDYQKMSLMRNYLLDQASVLGPDHYFSLDSDILLDDPNTLI